MIKTDSIRFYFFLSFALCIMMQSENIYAQNSKTLHFIYFADTNDSEVGKSSEEANRYFINNFIPMVKQNTSLNIKTYYFYGQNFQRSKLNSVITNLQTSSNDAIFFYYTGHGFNQDNNDFPTLTLGLRGDALSSRTKPLLDIYNTLRNKPHRLLMVIAEACNAVYGSRTNSGNYTGNYDAFEGDNTKLQALFGESSGDYLMSSSKKGQKSFCPTGGLGYFTRGFKDALDERVNSFSISLLLNKVAKNTTKYASDYAAEDQHPQWLSGIYSDGKSKKPSLSSSTRVQSSKGEIKNVSVETSEENLIVKVTFSISNMKGKNGRVACYFYDNDGNALKDQNSSYCSTNGNVSVGKDITPSYDNSAYTDFEVAIPKSELHQIGTYTRTLQVQLVVWDMSKTEAVELFRSGYESFLFTPSISYLKVDGKTADKSVNFSENGGQKTFNVDTSSDTFETWGIPSWCSITEKTSTSFTLICEANTSSEERADYMKVKASGKELRIDISQTGRSGPSAEIENVWVEHNVINGMFKGMNIHVKFSIDGMKNKRCNIIAAFYYGDNTTPLKNQFGGNLTYNSYGNVTYDSARWDNFTFFVPYSGLFIIGSGMGNYSFDIIINDHNGNKLARHNNIQFTYWQ
ncbi:caspase family protein [Bacteroides sp.]